MYLSPWQLAKFMVWLENELATTVPVVMLCDFFFCFQNRCAQLQRPLRKVRLSALAGRRPGMV